MKNKQPNGNTVIDAIARRLDFENVRTHDSAIVNKLRSLTQQEFNQIVIFGDVTAWRNEALARAEKGGAL